MTIHPRVCLHQVAFASESTTAFVDHCRAIGMPNVTLVTPILMQPGGVEEARRALAAGGPKAAVINHPIAMGASLDRVGSEETQKLQQAVDIAAALGAPVIYLVSGGRGSLLWEDAAERFAELIAPCLPSARENGVQITVESASPLNADMHIAHTLDDTIRLAGVAGIGVCIELNACWYEANLKDKFRRAMPLTALVQVSDYVLGDRFTPNRAVPGDGVVPLEWLLGTLLDLGYAGVFDLELVGPRIEQEGPRAASRRSAEYLSEILVKLGA